MATRKQSYSNVCRKLSPLFPSRSATHCGPTLSGIMELPSPPQTFSTRSIKFWLPGMRPLRKRDTTRSGTGFYGTCQKTHALSRLSSPRRTQHGTNFLPFQPGLFYSALPSRASSSLLPFSRPCPLARALSVWKNGSAAPVSHSSQTRTTGVTCPILSGSSLFLWNHPHCKRKRFALGKCRLSIRRRTHALPRPLPL